MTTFRDLITDEPLLAAIKALGFSEPTDIQTQVIPLALQGKDLIGHAKTGSGKTLAFGIPLILKVSTQPGPQALIIVPTRELCQQIVAELSKLTQNLQFVAVYGGVSIGGQIQRLRNAQIVVATPGRLLDHMERRTIKTSNIRYLIFDEADRMFDMGFLKPMEQIVQSIPKDHQTMLFSATMPEPLRKLTAKYQRNPVHVKTHSHIESHLLPQEFYRVESNNKFSLLVHLLKEEDPDLAIIFCRTKHGSKKLARNLHHAKFDAQAMHGNLTQSQRNRVIADFKNGKIRFLVATDVAARGLDVKLITHIFNYNVPHVPDDYIHRIGRTARAGESGKAITFVERKNRADWNAILRRKGVFAVEKTADDVPHVHFQKRLTGRLGASHAKGRSRDSRRPQGDRKRPDRDSRRSEGNRKRPQRDERPPRDKKRSERDRRRPKRDENRREGSRGKRKQEHTRRFKKRPDQKPAQSFKEHRRRNPNGRRRRR